MRIYLFALLAFIITGCAPGGSEYGNDAGDQRLKVGVQDLYSIDANGSLQRDKQPEPVQNRASSANSVDRGATIGW
ncbi:MULTISPECIES: hypothetical protein [Tenebrionibacter/Tenebrionicola group]|jgi:hypothetical protein|uniref:Uncharacterized protein n=2 Tax=Tenebrionibacter/Tenebrionicola group TaxID=2969848 RepID=A0A8K0V7A6_9ENTR|nr:MULTISPECIES: hypothetical protein [Tenebrionibacter/Tenebrionicola group]MBK4716405.1 hypothetical protein [Tenebrionibacter intestinalis]MBV5096540.1 hypothetical protein [Tenebrionicola larvae]